MDVLPGLRALAFRLSRWPVLLAWMALIFALSSIPNEFAPAPKPIPLDKLAHFCEYAALGFLLAGVAWRHTGQRRIGALLIAGAIVLGTLYGASDEFHQRFVPGRDPALDDLAADAIGSTAGALAAARALSRAADPAPPNT